MTVHYLFDDGPEESVIYERATEVLSTVADTCSKNGGESFNPREGMLVVFVALARLAGYAADPGVEPEAVWRAITGEDGRGMFDQFFAEGRREWAERMRS